MLSFSEAVTQTESHLEQLKEAQLKAECNELQLGIEQQCECINNAMLLAVNEYDISAGS